MYEVPAMPAPKKSQRFYRIGFLRRQASQMMPMSVRELRGRNASSLENTLPLVLQFGLALRDLMAHAH